MLDRYFQRSFWTFSLFVSGTTAYLTARILNAFVLDAMCPPPSNEPLSRPVPREVPRPSPALLERNLFLAERNLPLEMSHASKPIIDPSKCWPTTAHARLLATLVADMPRESMAIFSIKGQRAYVYRIGTSIHSGGEIRNIFQDRVLVWRNGRCEQFTFTPSKPPPGPVVFSAKPKAELGAGIRSVNDHTWIIPKTDRDRILSNLAKISQTVRIVPHFVDGHAVGFRLQAVRPNSVLAKLGLQNRDIIQRINGHEISSPETALALYTQLKNTQDITVDTLRDGQRRSLRYEIR